MCIRDSLIGIDAGSSVSVICPYISFVVRFALNIPLTRNWREVNFDIPLCIAWCFKQMKDKLLHIVRWQPKMCIRDRKTSAFTCSQEIIDAVLANGSGFSEGKMRIYEQFEKSLSAKENADFLKNEYGWGEAHQNNLTAMAEEIVLKELVYN